MAIRKVALDDKYTLERGQIYLTGIQALTRLLLVQSLRDRRAGLDTEGFVSGYRGSPLAGFDQQLWRARRHLESRRIRFQPGLNEDLAATAVWGTQMLDAAPRARPGGVFAMWYGKAPGVDRSGDAFRHANAAGTSRLGGVLAIAGDDHACKSSTLPSQSEYAFMDVGIPVLNPANVQEVLDFGLYGWAMSRYSGCWVALIALADTMDSSATVDADVDRVQIRLPDDFQPPPGGVHFRVGRSPLEQEELLHRHKLYGALAFARANGLDRTVLDSPRARFGIATTGKAYLDVRQALEDLGIGEKEAAEIGIRLYKVGMPWPLDRVGIRRFGEGLEEILVVEEKRAVMENQIKEQLYNAPGEWRPRVVGKFDENGRWLIPSMGDLAPGQVARAIAQRLAGRFRSERIELRLRELEASERALEAVRGEPTRTPFFCSGCPHNTSTRLPEGSRAVAGIGCHYMVRWMDRHTDTFSQMGGEGVHWIGQAPFSEEKHIFANLGDGTYYHSGSLAIRAAVAAGIDITYKILFNDAVAMTGGQRLDGPLTVPRLTRQLAAEGVRLIAVVTDEPRKYGPDAGFASGVTLHHRDALDAVQRELRETKGCTALVYDQTCAAELRRRRKRGVAEDRPLRAFINEAVCEGCGDCSVQSNCASIEPLETEYGRKRAINQSSCNKDFSCLNGLCPAFVTLDGARLRRPDPGGLSDPGEAAELPEPQRPALDAPWNLLVTGVGGTGVVTIGALLGMAAHLEGRGSTVLDMTGLAQKGGAVMSHVRLAARPEEIHTPRVAVRRADALLACDLIVAASPDTLERLDVARTQSVVNTHIAPTAEFVRNSDVRYDGGRLMERVHGESRELWSLDATGLASSWLGDEVASNVLVLGFAWQKGLIPLSLEALTRAIELNGVAVEANQQALHWGRRLACDPELARRASAGSAAPRLAPARTLEELVDRRSRELVSYQDEAWARRYRSLVGRVQHAERLRVPGRTELSDAVARSHYKLLAYKDEYEVARLYTNGEFRSRLESQFEGRLRPRLHLAPPLFARPDPATGRPKKRAYGAWMWGLLELLARLKFLRGTPFDPFGYTRERRLERQLIADYERTVEQLLEFLTPENHALAVRIAALPQEIRGFGVVKERSAERFRLAEKPLLERYLKPEDPDEGAAAPERAAG